MQRTDEGEVIKVGAIIINRTVYVEWDKEVIITPTSAQFIIDFSIAGLELIFKEIRPGITSSSPD